MKLQKEDNEYYFVDEHYDTIASTDSVMLKVCEDVKKLSLKNCEAIENGYDLDKLSLSYVSDHLTKGTDEYHNSQIDFKEGFQKALEILGDKKFSEEDILDAWEDGATNNHPLTKSKKENLLKSLQQTEWDVEIEMEVINEQFSPGATCIADSDYITVTKAPKLDADSCLILKRK